MTKKLQIIGLNFGCVARTVGAPASLTRALLAAALLASALSPADAGEKVLRIGVLTDLSSFAETSMGRGSVAATQIAVQDFGGSVLGKPIEVISADMQSKPDLAVTLARHWYDVDDVDVIVDVPASAGALAIQPMALEKHKLFIATVAATSELTGKACSPTGIHWGTDTAGTARGVVDALAQGGAKSWFFLMPDFAVGKSVAAFARTAVEANGGKVLQTVFFPPNNSEYAQFLLEAQQSGADVIGLGGIGLDLVAAIKQAVEFHILPSSRQKLAAFLMNLSDVHAVGLETVQGVRLVQDFYWDTNDETRAFAKKFFALRQKMPNNTQAANYSGVLAYLNAVKGAGTDDPATVVARMKSGPLDHFGEKATLRADGRAIFDVGLYRVKAPSESKYPWDYLALEQTIPGDRIFLPLADSACPLVKKP
jgi:branched-chain amino acid transport system substrate-binding protein